MLATPEMTETDRIERWLGHPDVAALDVSAFAEGDLANIVLQRSSVLYGLSRKPGDIIRAWEAGDAAPLDAAVSELQGAIALRAAAGIRAEYEEVAPLIAEAGPRRIADIGCGYALFDLFAHRATGASLLLVDIEQNERRHFGFDAQAAAYSNLSVARAFLEANGVEPSRIETINPADAPLDAAEPVDLAVSFLSCGFHYPVSAYAPFFREGVRPGGRIILDLRRRRAARQIADLQALGSVREIGAGPKVVRVEVRRAAE